MFKRTDKPVWIKMQRPSHDDHRNQTIRKRLEAPGVEPVFLNQEDAIDYATGRACFRSGEIRILDSSGDLESTIQFNDVDRKL
jgi:hypothetical protein